MVAGFALLSLTIGAGMAWQGFWPVLPFAGLEVLLVALGLYHVARYSHQREVVVVQSDAVVVQRGRNRLEQQWCFARPLVLICLERPRSSWYPSRLLIRSGDEGVELGRFLVEDERRLLASQLRQALS